LKKQPVTLSGSKCAVCWNEKNPDEDAVEVSNEYILQKFNVCKKHKEALMSAVCSCGNQDLTYKSGISKTSGKKWQGWKCEKCDIMYGMNGMPWGDKPKAPVGNFQPSRQAPQITTSNSVEKKLDAILAILKENFPPLKDEVISEEESPF
jgi:hypothetical protein